MNGVLVASGSLSVRMDLDEALASGGFYFLTVSTAAQARSIIEHEPVSLIVLDPVLRDTDGLSFLTELRRNPRLKSTPILVLCSEADYERGDDDSTAWENFEFLGKPYDKDHIVERAQHFASRLDSTTGEPARPSVLAIDSDSNYLQALEDRLSDDDFTVKTCSNREDAQDLMRQNTLDAILIELDLVHRSGRNLRRWVRTLGQQPTTAILVVTESDDRESMVTVFTSGADDYVVKSDNFEGLIGRLRAQMQRKKSENETRRMREALLIKAMQTTESERARRNAEARATLIAELEAKNRELDRARVEAEAGAAAKSAFLASMSHEIRTPMNAILGMAELLESTPLDGEQRQRLDVIRSSGSHLLTLIDQILDFSKIEAGKMDLEIGPVDVQKVIEDALEIVSVSASQKNIDVNFRIDGDVPSGFLGDVGRVRQVLINYLSNAVKFTEQGEITVEVSAEHIEDDSYRFQFVVKDTGIGIDEALQSKLFETFSQLDHSAARQFSGTGLGLAISRRLVELMGGRVWVDSEVGGGSSFYFTVPGTSIEIAEAPENAAPVLRGLRILIVDDNETSRELIATYAESWGAHTIEAADAQSALGLIAGNDPFDLALVDFDLPDSSGIDLAAEIRKLAAGGKLPMIMLGSINNAVKMSKDFVAFIAKPVRRGTLYESLQKVSQEHGTQAATSTRRGKRSDNEQAEIPDAGRRIEDLLPSYSVLLVEDNRLNRQVAELMLKKFGLTPDVAESGEEALEKVGTKRYDIIFMDVNMPKMDGVETTVRIRDLPLDGHQPRIIALTASVMTEDRERCREAGMDDFVSKPVSQARLRDALSRAAENNAA